VLPQHYGVKMPRPKIVIRLIVAALAAVAAFPAASQVVVTDAWVRGMVAGQTTTGAFMQLKSATDTTLIGVASPAAGIVEIHATKNEGGMMKMNAVDRVPLPAGRIVELKAGGSHVMMMNVRQPLKEGDTVPITLTFEDQAGRKSTQVVTARVRGLTTPGGATQPRSAQPHPKVGAATTPARLTLRGNPVKLA
jgi:copper(I)-binding protein